MALGVNLGRARPNATLTSVTTSTQVLPHVRILRHLVQALLEILGLAAHLGSLALRLLGPRSHISRGAQQGLHLLLQRRLLLRFRWRRRFVRHGRL